MNLSENSHEKSRVKMDFKRVNARELGLCLHGAENV